MTYAIVWWSLAAVTVAGALGVAFSREVMRLMLSLGAFLLGVAGLYAYYAAPMLAVAQVFVYVGGVLVLFVFAITALRRDDEGKLRLERRGDIGAASAAIGLGAMLVIALGPITSQLRMVPVNPVSVDAIGDALLGHLLPQFEAAGVLLLAALVAALAVSGRGGERS